MVKKWLNPKPCFAHEDSLIQASQTTSPRPHRLHMADGARTPLSELPGQRISCFPWLPEEATCAHISPEVYRDSPLQDASVGGVAATQSPVLSSEGSSDSLFSVTVSFLPSGPRDGWGGHNRRLSGHHVSAGCLRRRAAEATQIQFWALCVFKTRGLMGSQIKLYFRNHVSELTSECSILLKEPGEILWELFITVKIQCLKLGQRYVLKCRNPFGRSFQTGRTTCWEALRCNGKHLQPTQNC